MWRACPIFFTPNLSPRRKPRRYSAHSPACPGPRACHSTLPCGEVRGSWARSKRVPSVRIGRASVTSSGRKSGAGKPTHPTWLKPTGSSTAAVCSTTSNHRSPKRQGGLAAPRYKRLLGGYAALRLDDFLGGTSQRECCGDGGVCGGGSSPKYIDGPTIAARS